MAFRRMIDGFRLTLLIGSSHLSLFLFTDTFGFSQCVHCLRIKLFTWSGSRYLWGVLTGFCFVFCRTCNQKLSDVLFVLQLVALSYFQH